MKEEERILGFLMANPKFVKTPRYALDGEDFLPAFAQPRQPNSLTDIPRSEHQPLSYGSLEKM